ncbi:hypothetical protein MUK72_14435 (plasmid) [Halococcus dombrowskii]|uniref:Transposase n=1 Tax=Halococcus dombrowskii TaxID=179637 RepID=A0AAV3SD62_HALDO|nr:hypothetical protein [Halococcus dombrowskii]UOO96742.1 hypothetical protein MUK72_14435 [Halococcus dombrowskii]
MSVETTDTTDTVDTAGEQSENKLVAVLCGLDESAEPWKLRPPENGDDLAKLLGRVGKSFRTVWAVAETKS